MNIFERAAIVIIRQPSKSAILFTTHLCFKYGFVGSFLYEKCHAHYGGAFINASSRSYDSHL